MRKCVYSLLLVIALLVCLCPTAPAAETSADVIKYIAHSPSSQYFAKGRELYKAGKYTESMVTLKKAVEDGDAWAAALIGSIYSGGGDGIESDMNNAVKWYNKAKEMGYPASDAFFARMYVVGDVIPQDINKAYQLIHGIENLDLEDDDIIPNLAYWFYMIGVGTPQDLQKATQIAQRIKDANYRQKALKAIADEVEANKGIPAGTLITEVGKNQMRFDKRYKGKQITTVGFVGSIDEKNGGYVISLFGEQGIVNPFHYIECRFPVTQEDKLLELDKGDRVLIKGTYRGKEAFQVGAIVLHNCIVGN